jgi:hypothetical protein
MAETVRHTFVTEPVRVSFPYLFKPRARMDGNGDPRYEAVLLIPPTSGDGPRIRDLMQQAITDKFGDDAKLTATERAKLPLKHASESKWFADQFPGWHYVNAWSRVKPNVVDENLEEIIDPSKIYAGCWCRFQLTLLGWQSKQGGKLVLVSLDNVQFVGDGERLGGGKQSAKSAFEGIKFQIPEEMKSAAQGEVEEDPPF